MIPQSCTCNEEKNVIMTVSRACYMDDGGEKLFRCPYNEVLVKIKLYEYEDGTGDVKEVDPRCLCLDNLTGMGIFATFDMICRPDGTVDCKDDYHFNLDGVCH